MKTFYLWRSRLPDSEYLSLRSEPPQTSQGTILAQGKEEVLENLLALMGYEFYTKVTPVARLYVRGGT